METNYSEIRKYEQARKKVEKIKAFYITLLAYCITIPFLIFINLKFSPEFQWFWFPMLGWGIGLTFQGLYAFNYSLIFGKNWEERKIKEFMENEKSKF